VSEWIGGIHAVEGALRNDPGHVSEILIEQGARNPRHKSLLERARQLGIPVHGRAREAMDKAGGGLRHQGVLARYSAPDTLDESALEGLIAAAGQDALLLILDGVQDPHNFGACLRSAEAAGVSAVVIPKDRAVGLTPTVLKASAGAANRVPVVKVTNLARALELIKRAGVWLTGLAGEGTRSFYEIDLAGPVGLVLGGEGEGLRRLTRDLCDHLAQIPMRGAVESLNVSVATGIALFEALRQRNATAKRTMAR
jgi:23S rRNA (guanosine2251-2'-O)-methyltransferase